MPDPEVTNPQGVVIYGKRPLYPEQNYVNTHGHAPPAAQRFRERGVSAQRARIILKNWEQHVRDTKQVDSKHPKKGEVPVGTQRMFADFGLGRPTFFTSSQGVQVITPVFDADGDLIIDPNDGEAWEVRIERTGLWAVFLNGPIHAVDPIHDVHVKGDLVFKSPDLAVTRYQDRQVHFAEKLQDARLLPPEELGDGRSGWHPKTSSKTRREGERLRSELLHPAG